MKPIKTFVEKEGLGGQLQQRKQTGKPCKENRNVVKSSDEIIEIADDEDEDEFDDGIDYSAINLGY